MQRESQRVHQTGSSLERISEVAEKSARLVEGISHSTNDQVLTTRELVRAMQRVSSVASQTQERTTEARASIKALRKSCEPWRRPSDSLPPTAADRPDVPVFSSPAFSAVDGAHAMSPPLILSSRGPSAVGRDQRRELAGSGHLQ
jgi:hypothetical protein